MIELLQWAAWICMKGCAVAFVLIIQLPMWVYFAAAVHAVLENE